MHVASIFLTKQLIGSHYIDFQDGSPPLHSAISGNHLDVVELLIEKYSASPTEGATHVRNCSHVTSIIIATHAYCERASSICSKISAMDGDRHFLLSLIHNMMLEQ